MNDLGMALAWSAVQVTLVMVPAAAIHAIASRRCPASGSWVASVSLGLIVVLGLWSVVYPGEGREGRTVPRDPAARLVGTARVATEIPADGLRDDPRGSVTRRD